MDKNFEFLLSNLPDEIYENISSFVPLKDRSTIEKVSKYFIPYRTSKQDFLKSLTGNINVEFLSQLEKNLENGDITFDDLTFIFSDRVSNENFGMVIEQLNEENLFKIILKTFDLEKVLKKHSDDFNFLSFIKFGSNLTNTQVEEKMKIYYFHVENICNDLRKYFESKLNKNFPNHIKNFDLYSEQVIKKLKITLAYLSSNNMDIRKILYLNFLSKILKQIVDYKNYLLTNESKILSRIAKSIPSTKIQKLIIEPLEINCRELLE
jgi:hypothetical protein